MKTILLILATITLVSTVSVSDASTEVAVIRSKRQIYYLCGNFPNQYLSLTPCNNNNGCSTCCQATCSTSSYCQQIRSNWRCINGCCRLPSYEPTLPPTIPTTQSPVNPNPICGGRETSGGYCRSGSVCGSGYLCTENNVCCRCAFGTSIGPCVNQKCPDNTYCSPTNNCCPYLVK
uniref:CC domain-containing protein n=1 Tax=Caenorhabditis japonica TaxID=281687 RepID=A0A8R1HS29_CAEJA